MLARIRKSMEEKDQGFTLIELLVVVVIIGILAAIAIPTFLNQRKKAWEKAALSDLRNASVVNEEVFSSSGSYASAASQLLTPTDSTIVGAKLSDGVTFTTVTGTTTSYCIQVSHSKLPGDTFALNSANGVAKKGATC